MCLFCELSCEKCKPKYLTCPLCSAKVFMYLPECSSCGIALTEESRQQAWDDWRRKREDQ
jgi:ribosomal protein L37E